MRHLTGVLLAGVAMVTLASSAHAQDLTLDFAGLKSGTVEIAPGDPMAIQPNSSGQINGFIDLLQPGPGSNGGSVKAIVNLNSNLVTFESGTATVGSDSISRATSGIDITFANTGDGSIGLEAFRSTIIPAGMGFYVQDRSTQLSMGGNPFTDYGQSLTTEFSDFYTGVNGTFAQAEFDFEVTTLATTLYALKGIVSLSFDGSTVVKSESFTTYSGGQFQTVNNFLNAGQSLTDFTTGIENHHALEYDWKATNILIPLSGILSGYTNQIVSYRAIVSSWTKSSCINDGSNCIVAFAGFGDPVGRGGGVEEFSRTIESLQPSFDEMAVGNDPQGDPTHNFVIGGLNFGPVTVNVAAVPEPSTWALMISGFGLAGAALRRRRRVAYS